MRWKHTHVHKHARTRFNLLEMENNRILNLKQRQFTSRILSSTKHPKRKWHYHFPSTLVMFEVGGTQKRYKPHSSPKRKAVRHAYYLSFPKKLFLLEKREAGQEGIKHSKRMKYHFSAISKIKSQQFTVSLCSHLHEINSAWIFLSLLYCPISIITTYNKTAFPMENGHKHERP